MARREVERHAAATLQDQESCLAQVALENGALTVRVIWR